LNLPDTEYETIFSSFSSSANNLLYKGKFSTSYDSYHNPVTSDAYDFNITDTAAGTGMYDTAADRMTHFYYEQYNLAVSQVAAPPAVISVFPNPATDIVNVSITGIVAGSRVNLILENLLGKTILTESMPWVNNTEMLPMKGFAAGAYILSVLDDKGNRLSVQKIIKQ
jgi:hypothetical protein